MKSIISDFSFQALPRTSVILFAASLGILVLFITLVVIPNYREIENKKAQGRQLSLDLELKDKIVPAYAKARQMNNDVFVPPLPVPEKKFLNKNELHSFINSFKMIAANHQMNLLENKVNTARLNSETDKLSIYLDLEGNLENFRSFLIALISLPSYYGLEGILIYPGTGDKKRIFVNFTINIGV